GVKPYEESAYWRDVGTIRSYYDAQMDQLGRTPAFDLDNPRWPILARSAEGPPARVLSGNIEDSMLGEGSTVEDARIVRSILARGVRAAAGATVSSSIVMDYTEIAPGAHISGAIIDRYNNTPADARLERGSEQDAGLTVQRDPSGILVVPRGEPP